MFFGELRNLNSGLYIVFTLWIFLEADKVSNEDDTCLWDGGKL